MDTIKNKIKSGNLWAAAGFRIGSKYILERDLLGLKTGTSFTFFGFGHDRVDSSDVVCILEEGALEPVTFLVSRREKIVEQLKRSAKPIDLWGRVKFRLLSLL